MFELSWELVQVWWSKAMVLDGYGNVYLCALDGLHCLKIYSYLLFQEFPNFSEIFCKILV